MPPVARQQRDRVDHKPGGVPATAGAGRRSGRSRPIVDDKRVLAHTEPVAETLEKARQSVHRVVKAWGILGVAPAGQVEGEGRAVEPLEEGNPVLRMAGIAVDEDRGGPAPPTGGRSSGPRPRRRRALPPFPSGRKISCPAWRRRRQVRGRGPGAPACGRSAPPAGDLRPARQSPARTSDRRAGADDPVAEHQRSKSRRRLRTAARGAADLGGGPRRRGRGRRGGDPAGRTGAVEGATDSSRCSASSRSWTTSRPSTGSPTPTATRRSTSWSRSRSRRKTAACVMIFALGGPRSRSTPTSTGSAGGLACLRARLVRARPRRDAGDHRSRGRVRAPHQPDHPRPPGLQATTAMRSVRVAANVPWYRRTRVTAGRFPGA